MARKILTLKIEAAGRDAGKAFVITEMPARAAHSWATRALFAALNGGVEIPDDLASAGMAGIAAVGLAALGRINAAVAEPMLNELLACVAYMPTPGNPAITRPLIDDDIEEVATLFRLQKEALMLHVDFFTAASRPTSE